MEPFPNDPSQLDLSRLDPTPLTPAPPAPSRLTMVSHVYHYPPGQSPTATEVGYTHVIASDEQPWKRWFQATEDWQPLQCGWLESACLLILTNEEGKGLQRIPTQAEQAEIAARVVELGIMTDQEVWTIAEVAAGRGCQLTPHRLHQLHVRCRQGKARCVLTLIPR